MSGWFPEMPRASPKISGGSEGVREAACKLGHVRAATKELHNGDGLRLRGEEEEGRGERESELDKLRDAMNSTLCVTKE